MGGYQAPEFLRGLEPTPACDVYSLGILLWQLDSRCIPYLGQHPQAIIYSVVSVGARPEVPHPNVAHVGISAFCDLYKLCWAPLSEERPLMKNVVRNLINISLNSTNSPITSTSTLKVATKLRTLR